MDIQSSIDQKPPTRRQLSKGKTREKVISAGRTLFMSGGYGTATVRDIAKGAGKSTGALFANFAGKADLLLTVAQDELPFQKELLERVAGVEGAILDQVVRVCVADFSFFNERLHLFEALAGLETHVDRDGTNPHDTADRAQLISSKRRATVHTHVGHLLTKARCGNDAFTDALAEVMVSAHWTWCREAALEGRAANEYRDKLKKYFSFLTSPRAASLAA